MIVRPYDGTPPKPAPSIKPPADAVLVYTPFRTVKLGHSQELRIDLGQKGDKLSVSCRFWKSTGRGKPLKPEPPMHIFPEYLPDLIAALEAAGDALGISENAHAES